jgi:hypothetical protein
VTVNNQKLVNVANGTGSLDGVNFGQLTGRMPVPTGGDALVGQVPVATGVGNATTWGTVGDGDGSGITSVSAGDGSIVAGGTAEAITLETGTLDQIASLHPPAANWSNNSRKITSLANGAAVSDAMAFGQIPNSEPPGVNGLIAWNFDPQASAGSGSQLTGGTAYAQRIDTNGTTTPSKAWIIITAAGSGASAGTNFLGLYNSAGTLLGTAATDSLVTASNAQSGTLTAVAGQSLAGLTPGTYYVGVLFGAATMPTLLRGVNNGNFANFGTANAAGTYRQCVAGTAQTSLPTAATFTSSGNNSFWAGIS